MDAVYHVPKESLYKEEAKRIDLYKKSFNSWGNNIYSEQFGDVRLPNSSAKSDEHHGRTKEKYASIEAISAVIQNGTVIFHGIKKNGVSERFVVAAPILIGEDPYYMGVMLNRDEQSQRLYLHDVVKDVSIEKEMPTVSQAHRHTPGSLDTDEHFYMSTILQDALNVKRNLLSASNAQVSEKDAGTTSSPDGKNSLRMAEGSTSPVSAQERAATLPTFGEGKEAAGGLAEEVENPTAGHRLRQSTTLPCDLVGEAPTATDGSCHLAILLSCYLAILLSADC